MKERNASIEVLRILCCFLVIGIHVTPLYDLYIKMNISKIEMLSALFVQSMVRLGLPVFFIISGMFLLNRKITSISAFYKKRMISLIIPFLIFSAFHYFALGFGIPNASTSELVLGYLNGLLSSTGISVHLWFVYAMIGIYFITPLISMFFQSIGEKEAVIACIFILSIKVYNLYLPGYINGLVIPDINTWLAYFMLGGLIPKLPKIPSKICVTIILLSYATTCIITYYQFNSNIRMFLAPFDAGLNMYLLSLFICILFANIKIEPANSSFKVIGFVSSCTYGIYLIHILILKELNANVDMDWYINASFSYTIIVTSIIFIISLVITFILNKVIVNPLIKFFN